MAKRKTKKATYFSINTKYANTQLKKINELMKKLKTEVGQKGDAEANKSTLIGAVEEMNQQAYDGVSLTNAYKRFNTTTMSTFRKQVASLDFEFEAVDKIAR